MTARVRALSYLALSTYFAALLLLAARVDAPRVGAAAAWGMGASLGLSVAWWQTAERERGR